MNGRRTFGKDRFGAFMDAVVAIIMTILVLELERPETISWEALWDMRMSFVAYAVSFFSISVMWMTWHRDWHDIEAVSGTAVWAALAVLFVMSFVPFATSLIVADFANVVSQTMYSLITLFLILANSFFHRSLSRTERNAVHATYLRSHARLLLANVFLMLVFIVLGLFTMPEIASVGIVASSVVYILPLEGRQIGSEQQTS